MDLKILENTPPWDWPEDSGRKLLAILSNDLVDESDRLRAAELAGNWTVINDEIVDALLSILGRDTEPEKLRANAAISLGPVLEHGDMDGFDDPDESPVTEPTFHRIQARLRNLYLDAGVPKEVRRRILEASVRAPQDWHQDAIGAAYSRGDEDWKLTAVFSMRWVRGFDDQILEALEDDHKDIHYEAVCAAGNWQLGDAWAHVSKLVASKETDNPLLLAAIEAVAEIRPQEAEGVLVHLTDSDDEDIVEAAFEATATAEGPWSDEDDDDDDDGDRH